jgi:hypothetical protein
MILPLEAKLRRIFLIVPTNATEPSRADISESASTGDVRYIADSDLITVTTNLPSLITHI